MADLSAKLNEQFNFEVESAYIYMAMANYVEVEGMHGFSHFFVEQAKEEMEHAEAFYHFMLEMDMVPEYDTLAKPKAEYGNFVDTFKAALEHEKEVTGRIKAIYEAAIEEGCLDTQQFLNQFLAEQREEEDTFRDLVERLERIHENWGGLYILDGQLAKR
ncbi:MAG: ferritin [Peptoniphilus sp.]|nr:ferritin [Peptoniphilus sp.]MDD7363164.1 ferritin [Bacillota bacterium]MDY6044512.1 ferritin [Peptoniphilus sp.]